MEYSTALLPALLPFRAFQSTHRRT
ncbi:hypothetical protein CCHR01_06285 [Colletotrichum chrysophilum]|uniref:Uncharacterized protein n=1 Tax=Colletotrichum chrysophilum TaxID=1836956 RepID=A0AAD9EKQ1_9PEZI|nr:hypothetical protein CCHR01_06285 [Colletotrichum chrysophilum]